MALVTGAASGIGAELCRILGREGYGLMLVDRDAGGLERIEGELEEKGANTVHTFVQDLSSAEAVPNIMGWIAGLGVQVDVLVNNAGFGTFGPFWEIAPERDRDLVTVNIMVPVLLTKALLPGMVERGRGRVLNVGSVSGFGASPYATCYYASKSFILAFSSGLQSSLEGTGVTVTVVCPGPTRTAFDWTQPGKSSTPAKRERFQMEASTVAETAYRGMERGHMIVIPGWSNRALALLAKFLPRKVSLSLVKRGQRAVN